MNVANLPFFPQHRYLMTQIGQQELAFPLTWVAELILVEQSHILALPFYDPMLLGVFHYRGDVVPLVIAPLGKKGETAATAQRLRMKRTLTAVRLNQAVDHLAGVGIIVDRVVERIASNSISKQPPETVTEMASELSVVSQIDFSKNTSKEAGQAVTQAKLTSQIGALSQIRVFQIEDIPPEIWQPR